jgi:hypothetical protein
MDASVNDRKQNPHERDRSRPKKQPAVPPAAAEDGYDIGYKKPPPDSRFKKGQSGNPDGRPSKSRNYKSLVDELLASEISIREGGKTKPVTIRRAMLMKMIEKALNGEMRPIEMLLKIDDMIERASSDAEEKKIEQQTSDELDIPDSFLEDYIQKKMKNNTGEKK